MFLGNLQQNKHKGPPTLASGYGDMLFRFQPTDIPGGGFACGGTADDLFRAAREQIRKEVTVMIGN